MARVRKRPGVVRSVLVVAGGMVFFIAGLFVHRSYSPYPDGLSTVGTITDLRSAQDNHGKVAYMAVYTFTTADGRTVSFDDPASSSHRPTVGDHVRVSYQPATPERARRIPRFDWFGWAVITFGSGLAVWGLHDLVRAAQRLYVRSVVFRS
jgi:hypothetical protein